MAQEPLVSIIIPTYNRSELVKRAIRSALAQTHRPIEVIVVDDRSTDDTKQVVTSFSDTRIKYLKNSKNLGGPATRNKGLEVSKGDYINFLDDDDTIHPRKIELQLQKFTTSNIPNLGVVTCDVKYQRSDIKRTKKNRLQGELYTQLLQAYCIYGTETMLIRTQAVKEISGFDTSLLSNQEYDLQLRLANKYSFDYVNKVLATKHETKGQISFNFDKKIQGTKTLYNKYKQEYKTHGVYLYNFFRFTYLLTKYRIGKYFGKQVYLWLP